jgi:sugar/nucleoside kinase (ribokinase family)
MSEPVVVLGNPVIDCALEIECLPVEAGRHQELRDVFVGPGGSANVLIAGARLGLAMQALGVVGDDMAGRQVLDWLRAEGVDVDLVAVRPGERTANVFILNTPHGEQSLMGFHSSHTAMEMPSGWQESIRQASALYFDGWAYGALGRELTLRAVHLANESGVPVFFDPGPPLQRFEPDWLSQVLRHITALSLTEDEARVIAPHAPTLEVLAAALRARGPRLAVIKRGPCGCLLQRDGETAVHPGFAVPVRDTTGAGDAVAAAIILAWLRQHDLPTSAAFANAAGAVTVQRLGAGLNMPHLAEINALLQREGISL